MARRRAELDALPAAAGRAAGAHGARPAHGRPARRRVACITKCPRDRWSGPGAWHRRANFDATSTLPTPTVVPAARTARVHAASLALLGAAPTTEGATTMDAEYHELRVAAAEALRALLMKSEPGTGATLHAAYAELRHEIGRSEGAAPVAASPVAPHWEVAAQEWKKTTTVYEREQTVLEHIADDRLTVRELDERMRAAGVDCWISTVQSIVNRLYSRGDLTREREQLTPRKYRWRYFRPALEGPIADLNRQMGA